MIHWFLARWRDGYWRLCSHHSHRLRLPCFRLFVWDGFCTRHHNLCWNGCPNVKEPTCR